MKKDKIFKKLSVSCIAISLLWFVTSCESNTKNQAQEESVSSGQITVASDESFQPVIEAEEMAFENTYRSAQLNVIYKPEIEAINLMLHSKARMAIVTRELNEREKQNFANEKIKYRSLKIAYDAVALITNNANQNKKITTQEFGELLMKKKSKWSQIGKNGSNENVVIVFDNSSSSNLIYMMNKYGLKDKSNLPFYAVKGNKAVIEYVKTHKNALGVIGVNWISDGDDPAAKRFVTDITVLSVADKSSLNDEYYEPFGYNILYKWYPFRREIFVLLKEPMLGLGTGFMDYLGTDQGQLVVLKAGLIPATRPVYIQEAKIPK